MPSSSSFRLSLRVSSRTRNHGRTGNAANPTQPTPPHLTPPHITPHRPQELRETARVAGGSAEQFEAAAAAAEEQATALRAERDEAREELSATRSVVEAADGRVVSLSEELEKLRQFRNKLDRRRVELQMELGGNKLKAAFGGGVGVGGGGGGGGALGGVFREWRVAFMESRHKKLISECETNRGKADSYEASGSWR